MKIIANCYNIFLKARLEAYDSAYPLNRARADLTIQVGRNQFGPVFSPTRYERTISENYPLGSDVVQLTATDSDGVSKCIKISLNSTKTSECTIKKKIKNVFVYVRVLYAFGYVQYTVLKL